MFQHCSGFLSEKLNVTMSYIAQNMGRIKIYNKFLVIMEMCTWPTEKLAEKCQAIFFPYFKHVEFVIAGPKIFFNNLTSHTKLLNSQRTFFSQTNF